MNLCVQAVVRLPLLAQELATGARADQRREGAALLVRRGLVFGAPHTPPQPHLSDQRRLLGGGHCRGAPGAAEPELEHRGRAAQRCRLSSDAAEHSQSCG